MRVQQGDAVITAEDVAAATGTNNYEVLTSALARPISACPAAADLTAPMTLQSTDDIT